MGYSLSMNNTYRPKKDITYGIRIKFLSETELDRFNSHTKERGIAKGFFTRQAILEKLDREEQKEGKE